MKKFVICILILVFSFLSCKTIYATEITEPENELKLEDGFYFILSGADNTKCLDVAASSKDSGANIQLNNLSNTPSQIYTILQKPDGWYMIRNINSQCNLDVAGANPESGTNLQQCVDNGNDAQAFKFYQTSDQYVYIKNKLGTYIDLYNGDTFSGNNIQLASFNGTFTQKWQLLKYTPSLIPANLENGTYVIQSSDNSYMSIENSAKITGKSIILTKSKAKKSREFIITRGNDGWYSIQNKNSRLYVDLAEHNTDTSILRQYPGHGQYSQKFQFYDNGGGNIVIFTKYGTVLSVKDNKFQLDSFSGSDDQLWTFRNIS